MKLLVPSTLSSWAVARTLDDDYLVQKVVWYKTPRKGRNGSVSSDDLDDKNSSQPRPKYRPINRYKLVYDGERGYSPGTMQDATKIKNWVVEVKAVIMASEECGLCSAEFSIIDLLHGFVLGSDSTIICTVVIASRKA